MVRSHNGGCADECCIFYGDHQVKDIFAIGADDIVCWFLDVLFHAELDEYRQEVFVDEIISLPW